MSSKLESQRLLGRSHARSSPELQHFGPSTRVARSNADFAHQPFDPAKHRPVARYTPPPAVVVGEPARSRRSQFMRREEGHNIVGVPYVPVTSHRTQSWKG